MMKGTLNYKLLDNIHLGPMSIAILDMEYCTLEEVPM
jgi:hypothetical protein